MRIGLCGAQGVGKTTLARALSKSLGITLIEEQARVAAKELGIENPGQLKGDPELGKMFQWRCLELQIAEEKKHNSFVTDRTTVDNAAYWLKWHAHKAESDQSLLYYHLAEANARNYSLVLYVPVEELAIENDGFRSVNSDYQKEMDYIIRMFLNTFSSLAFIPVAGHIKDRLRYASFAIESMRRY